MYNMVEHYVPVLQDAALARRQQLALRRAAPPRQQSASPVDCDEAAQSMASLLQLYRSQALDDLRGCGGEGRLWEAAALYLSHSAHVDPHTGEKLLRVANGRTATSKHLLQALHVATEARAWQGQELPTVGLPVPAVPAVDFRALDGAARGARVHDGTVPRPEFLVAGHEAIEELTAQPESAGKLVVAAPDVASLVVHTRRPAPLRAPGTSAPPPARRPSQRGWPAARPEAAAAVLGTLLETDVVEGKMPRRMPSAEQVARGANSAVDDTSGPVHVAGGEPGVEGVAQVAPREQSGCVRSEEDVEVEGHVVRCQEVIHHYTRARPWSGRRQKRVSSPRLLMVGITEEGHNLPQQPQSTPGADLIQAALRAKVADRVLLGCLHGK